MNVKIKKKDFYKFLLIFFSAIILIVIFTFMFSGTSTENTENLIIKEPVVQQTEVQGYSSFSNSTVENQFIEDIIGWIPFFVMFPVFLMMFGSVFRRGGLI